MADVRLRVVIGPTAAGKSAAALWLAERHGGAILSADSRQIYRGFDIGTAKPTAAELARVPHYGVDVADPRERYSAARWADEARRWMADAVQRGRTPMVVGGTGFYVRALVAPLFDAPPMDEARRAALERLLATLPSHELRRWVRTLDPDRAHLGRAQLLRAAEVALLTGRRISALHRAPPSRPPLPARYLVIDPGHERLRQRIEQRVDAMFAAGWGDEVRRLMRQVPPLAPAWNACGYAAVRDALAGGHDARAAREAVVVATRQYAKRQRTWIRHQLAGEAVTVMDPASPDAAARIEAWWAGEEATQPVDAHDGGVEAGR
ncbi:MAG TPA: tRNA (adenosine(37)-N6)-dimethylallyltransferase MiaA [Gemmatimonadaceae bacterium]|nr:tRNA (adenosine(37)-N6)-dimethylallyltransferase MiaA [Gemmatimonadaceae bacterium]